MKKVTKIDKLLTETAIKNENEESNGNNTSQHKKLGSNDLKAVVPRGKPKSGRIWKNEKSKFSSIIKTKGIRDNFAKKQALRTELKRVKEASRAIVASHKEEVERKKERRRNNLKRKEENRKKSEIVQVITNSTKLKRIKKKHLKYIEKRDTVNM